MRTILLCYFTLVGIASAQQPVPAVQKPQIEILSVPAFGSAGSLTGRVTGVDPAAYKVATYILVEGLGWYTKPATANPTVCIQTNGSFRVGVVTGGLDAYATNFYVALVEVGTVPPPALGSASLPRSSEFIADDHLERYGRTLQFANRTWGVKEAPLPVGPGNNIFSSDSNQVFVDALGRLHLTIQFDQFQWQCSEVVLMDELGYGKFILITEHDAANLDANATFGAFTWDNFGWADPVTQNVNREIDCEDSRWGNPGNPANSQFVVQPYHIPGNLIPYAIPNPPPTTILTRVIHWQESVIDFRAGYGSHPNGDIPPANLIIQTTYQHNPGNSHYVPVSGDQRWRFNLWLNTGGQPLSGNAVEVIIRDFQFIPN